MESAEPEPVLVRATRRRRAAAFVTDLAVLGVVGSLFGLIFFDVVSRWGPYGRGFGLVVMTAYLGAGASSLLDGRSLGKRLWGLRVAKIGGGTLSLAPALGRASLVSLAYLANGWGAKEVLLRPALAWVLSLLVFGVGGAMLYLFLFNRSTGQALHDLIFRTVVLRDPAPAPNSLGRLAGIHRLVLAGLAGLLVLGGVWAVRALPEAIAPHAAFWRELTADPRFFTVAVNHNTFHRGGNTTTTISVQAWIKDWSADNAPVITELATRAVEHYSSAPPDNLRVIVTRAFDLGICSWRMNHVDAGTFEEWKARTATVGERLPAADGR